MVLFKNGGASVLTIYDLTVEFVKEPIGVDNPNLRFAYKLMSDENNCLQTAYRIVVDGVWDSGIIKSDVSNNIAYEGALLLPKTFYTYEITVWDNHGNQAASKSNFETGMMQSDWGAKWITQDKYRSSWAPYFRKEFNLKAKVLKARAYISGLGCYELSLNGAKLSDNFLSPAQTNYNLSVLYDVYDITKNLNDGANTFGVLLGDGWYSQSRVWGLGTYHYGKPRFIMRAEIYYEDGTFEVIVSDESFKTDYSPITSNNLYAGECYDARLEQRGWDSAGFNDSKWDNAVSIDAPGGKLLCSLMPPIKKTRLVKPVSVKKLHAGDDKVFLYDMGENFAGWVKIKIPHSPPACEVVLRFAEDTDPLGNLDMRTTGIGATYVVQQDKYTSNGGAIEWEPRFVYHGFRFVEVTGIYADEPSLDFIEGCAVNTALEPNGRFNCSDRVINKLQGVILRTILSNYHGYPEDCPVREKCGWLGDAQLMSETCIYNFNMVLAYEKYLDDIKESKETYGTWQMIAPGKRTCGDATPLWGSAQVVIPWNLYLYYGDKAVLYKHYSNIKAWVEHMKVKSDSLISSWGLGDWCNPDGHASSKRIPVPQSSTIEFFNVAQLAAKIARVLNNAEDEKYFANLAEDIKNAFNKAFLKGDTYGYQATDAATLVLGICPNEVREAVASSLLQSITQNGGSFTTGIFGNKHLMNALTQTGNGGAALNSIVKKDFPSFGYMLEKGATSLWETFTHDNSLKKHLASLNHPMHGSFASWFYSHICGISPAEDNPGFKQFTVKPYIVGYINHADCSYETNYGTIKLSYKVCGDTFEISLVIPPNTTADVLLPSTCGEMTIDGNMVKESFADNRAIKSLGSGSYILKTKIY